MRILVCYKNEPDLDKIPVSSWLTPEEVSSMTGYVPWQTNIFDECSLEITRRRLVDSKQSILAVALSVGNHKNLSFSQTLMALGYTKCVNIMVDRDVRFSPNFVAYQISGYAKQVEKPDLIVMGKESAEGNNGQTGYLVAEILGFNCVDSVVDYNLEEKCTINVKVRQKDGDAWLKVQMPLVIIFESVPGIALKAPTLREKLVYKQYAPKSIKIMDSRENTDTSIKLTDNINQRHCVFINSLDEIINFIIDKTNNIGLIK